MKFLDDKHGNDWAIWEFRAEGTGYPDDAVYGRVRHYPWPDHHPPPFRLVPMIMASMRNWLHGGDLHDAKAAEGGATAKKERRTSFGQVVSDVLHHKKKRVVVVHCKAGKGRSGTVSCSYLISEEGWKPEEALARFTERRMRPKFGAGVSIPSQLRWITYVERWTRGNKKYFDRPIEIVEIHVWGLRNGVKIDVEAFKDEGKTIEVFHTFKKEERLVVEGNPPDGGGIADMMWEMAGYATTGKKPDPPALDEVAGETGGEIKQAGDKEKSSTQDAKRSKTEFLHQVSPPKAKTTANPTTAAPKEDTDSTEPSQESEPGGMAVILKPKEPIQIPNSDVNIAVERRNKSSKSMGLTMVTAVAHVWFNTFFEGHGPEQNGKPDESGVFSIEWDAMDGIKGSSRKGARALDRISVVWRFAGTAPSEEVAEPSEGQPVPQAQAADWKGAFKSDRDLGLRVQSPVSADVSKASSIRSAEEQQQKDGAAPGDDEGDIEGVKSSGPGGEELGGKGKVGDVKPEQQKGQESTSISGEAKESKTS